jgi:ribosomal protein S6--L-glutamate ligase
MNVVVLGATGGWHWDQLNAAAAQRSVRLWPVTYESLVATIGGSLPRRHNGSNVISTCDAVIARTMPLGSLEQVTFRLAVLHALEQNGIPVINPPRALEICIDKYATLEAAARVGIPVPETVVCQDRRSALEAYEALGGDVVIKPLLGSEGHGLIRVSDSEMAWRAATQLAQHAAVIYVQRFVPPGGQDLRLLFAGHRHWWIQRVNPTDWRTNHRRGATTRLAAAPADWSAFASRLQSALRLDYGACDLTGEPGHWQLLEVNAIPGWKGAQTVLPESYADALLTLVVERVQRSADSRTAVEPRTLSNTVSAMPSGVPHER